MEEGFEKTSHFLQLLAHSGHLTRKDVHLVQREEKKEEMLLAYMPMRPQSVGKSSQMSFL